MKYDLVGKDIVARAETPEESTLLLSLDTAVSSDEPSRRKHKKHNFPKTCLDCGKEFKGKQGIAVHRRRAHVALPFPPTVESTPV